ncbi:type II secretion system F family protein [Nocardioides sp.]|uniref:type II secretion system F family protein n=1 Tax=Nocardioides sp. TaxID=35761 RepID=UPI003527F738
MPKRLLSYVLAAWVAGTLALVGGPAVAADGASIAHVKPTKDGVKILVSVPEGADVDLGGVTVTLAGKDAEATARSADSDQAIKRTAILVIDTSNSMKGDRFAAAQEAARTFLATVPDNVYVGITTFASEVEQPLAPTLDRAQAVAVLDKLELSKKTSLYDGVIAATKQAGKDGQRSLLVLSDGADTSKTPLDQATKAIGDSEVDVDVVALEQKAKKLAPLEAMASAGNGSVINSDPEALQEAFASEADVLARQVVVVATLPEGLTATEGNIEVTLPAGGQTLTAKAYAPLSKGAPETAETAAPQYVPVSGFALPAWAMYAGTALLGLSLVVLFINLLPGKPKSDFTPDERVAQYTAMTAGIPNPNPVASERDISLAQAKEAAAAMLHHNQSLEARIAARLEHAGSNLKPAEWLLAHAAIAVISGAVGMLLGRGNIIVSIIFTVLGVVLPWVWLGFKRSRRLKAFNSSLPDTLQLMAGSLQAGLSLAQSVDTIVNEGTEPIAGEFKRVLVETRLGVTLEDALEGITERFDSKDFAWVVMAIKIQRQVGGNLAELLNTVAGTIREREYMRRQVAALAAEGKLSAVVLGGLPPTFLLYLLLTNGDYVMPMFTDPRGWVMLGGGALLLSVGVFWMSKMVKVEV